MINSRLSAFRLGDVRGVYPDEIDEEFAFAFAAAFARRFGPLRTVATGRDMRVSSEGLQAALNDGLMAAGLDVKDLGLCTTELGYFASTRPGISAAIIVTASHNPARYNGFKCVLRNGEAVAYDTGLSDVMELMVSARETRASSRGHLESWDLHSQYIGFLSSWFAVDPESVAHVALNGLNGTAATLAGRIAEEWQLPVSWFRKEPGPIPESGADPTNPELAAQMKTFMRQTDCSLGVAWDGDCDRCVFFDSEGDLVPTYYVVGLLAEHFLCMRPGSAIVHDGKLCWNTLQIIAEHGGKSVRSKTGHAFMKRKMREHHAVYGGELSSHHFFGDFSGCDSGMLAWLTVLGIVSGHRRDLEELVAERKARICCTPEINLRLVDAAAAFASIESAYADDALCIDRLDGLGIEVRGDWRFSLTESKTEPVVRLNMESRAGSHRLLQEGARLLERLRAFQMDETDNLSRLIIQ